MTQLIIPALYMVLEKLDCFSRLKQLYFTCSVDAWFEGHNPEWWDDLYSFSVTMKHHGFSIGIKLTGEFGWDAVQRKWGWYEDVEWDECKYNLGNDLPILDIATEGDMIDDMLLPTVTTPFDAS
ncbi:hypothetical protein DM02DRAFT_688619 [Periconia macrospinosa]|uniref:Uncharacterized protein n=1 Tax=Periconia macrospinosa TaxID=97972 RepID=A0A2V1DDJ1_9PLEO|nr:hypothetical protein DM02DRAFT_688619 [Periconia macrospinosa]